MRLLIELKETRYIAKEIEIPNEIVESRVMQWKREGLDTEDEQIIIEMFDEYIDYEYRECEVVESDIEANYAKLKE